MSLPALCRHQHWEEAASREPLHRRSRWWTSSTKFRGATRLIHHDQAMALPVARRLRARD
jgi:hypothetical protein